MAGVVTDGGPTWLSTWRAGQVSTTDALSRFDGLSSLEPDEITGRWGGASLPTGHPLDGLLEGLGWHGKSFEGPDHVHPLLFRRASGRLVPIDPALMPVRIALSWPDLAHGRLAHAAFRALLPGLRAARHAAKLRSLEARGRRSAAVVYASQPITDHLRRIDANRIMGLMERPSMARPFFFVLSRDVDG